MKKLLVLIALVLTGLVKAQSGNYVIIIGDSIVASSNGLGILSGGGGSSAWGGITGTLTNQTDLVTEFAKYALIASSNNFTGDNTFAGTTTFSNTLNGVTGVFSGGVTVNGLSSSGAATFTNDFTFGDADGVEDYALFKVGMNGETETDFFAWQNLEGTAREMQVRMTDDIFQIAAPGFNSSLRFDFNNDRWILPASTIIQANAAGLSDGDYGDFTFSGGTATLDVGSVASPEISDGGVGTNDLADASVNEPKLNVTNSPTAGAYLTSTGANDFTWQTGLLNNSVTAATIVNGSVSEADLQISNSPFANAVLGFDGTDGFQWVAQTGGSGVAQTLSLSTNDLTLSDGGGTVDLSGYLDNTDAQTAAQVPFTPAGTIASTNVQAAIEEAVTEAAAAANNNDLIGWSVMAGNETLTATDWDTGKLVKTHNTVSNYIVTVNAASEVQEGEKIGFWQRGNGKIIVDLPGTDADFQTIDSIAPVYLIKDPFGNFVWTGNGQAATVDTEAPTVPANLASSGVGETSYTLSWDASTDNVGVTNYQYRIDGGVEVATGNVTSTQVTGLTESTTYSNEIRAVDANGNFSAWSAAVDVTTNSSAPATYGTNPSVGGNGTEIVNASGLAFQPGESNDNSLSAGTFNTTSNVVADTENAYGDYAIELVAADGNNDQARFDFTLNQGVTYVVTILYKNTVGSSLDVDYDFGGLITDLPATEWTLATFNVTPGNTGTKRFQFEFNGGSGGDTARIKMSIQAQQ